MFLPWKIANDSKDSPILSSSNQGNIFFFSNISQKKNNNTHKLALLYINI